MENLKNALLEIVEREYEGFRGDMLRKTKVEIFDDYYIINFYNEMRDFLNDSELSDEKYEALIKDGENGLLENLWYKFLKWDYASVGSYDDAEDFISEYVSYLRENQEAMQQ